MSDLPTVEGGDVHSPHTLSSFRDQRAGSKREGVNLASMLWGVLGEEEAKRQGSPSTPCWMPGEGMPKPGECLLQEAHSSNTVT